MFDRLADHTTNSLKNAGHIQDQDHWDCVHYGLEQIFSVLANVVTTLVIGLCIGRPKESVVLLICILLLRQYAGGYHARSHIRCYIISTIAVIALLLFSKWSTELPNRLCIVIALVGTLPVLLFSPVNDQNKPLDNEQKAQYRKMAIVIVLLEICLLFVFYSFKHYAYSFLIAGTIFVVGFAVCAGAIKNRFLHGQN